ncbi:hypothetical protein TYRP_021901, partial [Tyrophagus putrescentiae]
MHNGWAEQRKIHGRSALRIAGGTTKASTTKASGRRRLGQVNHDGPIAETLIGVPELGLCRDEGHLVAAGQQGLQGPHAAQHVAHALHGVGVDSQLPLRRGGGGGV